MGFPRFPACGPLIFPSGNTDQRYKKCICLENCTGYAKLLFSMVF